MKTGLIRQPQARQPRVEVPEEWNALTERVIAAAIEVHRHLSAGLAEKLYETALLHELQLNGLRAIQQREVTVFYKDLPLGRQLIDLVVEDLIVLELKAVESVHDAHLAQLVGYMRAADLPLGLLLNFHAPVMKQGIYRRINQTSSRFAPPPPPQPR